MNSDTELELDEIFFDRELWVKYDVPKMLGITISLSMFADCLLYPLWNLNTRFKVQGVIPVPWMEQGIWAQEGIRGLYAGLTVDVISNPFAQLLYYGNYELSKRYFQSSYSKYQANHPDLPTLETIEPTAHMALGAWAELSSSLLYCPQDVISSRLQIQGNFPERERRYKSGADAIVKILRKEGLKGLYRGLGTHLMTEAPTSAIAWLIFEGVTKWLKGYTKEHYHDWSEERPVLTHHLQAVIAGVIAGCIASGVTNPMDRTYFLAQAQAEEGTGQVRKFKHMPHAFAYVLRQEGVRGLYAGVRQRMMSYSPAFAAGFTLFEFIKYASLRDIEE